MRLPIFFTITSLLSLSSALASQHTILPDAFIKDTIPAPFRETVHPQRTTHEEISARIADFNELCHSFREDGVSGEDQEFLLGEIHENALAIFFKVEEEIYQAQQRYPFASATALIDFTQEQACNIRQNMYDIDIDMGVRILSVYEAADALCNAHREFLNRALNSLHTIESNSVEFFDEHGQSRGEVEKQLHMGRIRCKLNLTRGVGPIPPALFTDQRIRALFANSCGLTGEIPASIESFKGHTLDLSKNQLNGELPKELFQEHLSRLNLEKNQLTGFIPEEVRACENLSTIDISHNGFTGALPDVFSSLKSVREFFVQNNQINKIVFPENNWAMTANISKNPLLSIADHTAEFSLGLKQENGFHAHFDGAALDSLRNIWHALHTLATDAYIYALPKKRKTFAHYGSFELAQDPIVIGFVDRAENGTWNPETENPALILHIYRGATLHDPKTITVVSMSDALKSRLDMNEIEFLDTLNAVVFQPTPPSMTKAASAR